MSVPPEPDNILELPSLKHMPLVPGNRMSSNFRIRAPHLTSLHIQIDLLAQDRADERAMLLTEGKFLPEIQSGLCYYTISSDIAIYRYHNIRTQYLMSLIAPIFKRNVTLAKLTLRNITAHNNTSYPAPTFQGTGRIALLLFKKFSYHPEDSLSEWWTPAGYRMMR
jgi:hypothetical protein